MATPRSTDLGNLFFGAYRRRVLALLLLHPDESFHLREIARITATQPGTLRRELTLLADAGVLRREEIGNQAHYRADPTSPIYEELRSILRKTAGIAEILRGALSSLEDRISLAFVYGSVASGTERRASDIDVMVVGTVTLEEVVRAFLPYQEQLRREINPHVYAPAEFARKTRGDKGFLARVLAGQKLFLVGRSNDLGKLGANRKAKVPQSHPRGAQKAARRRPA